MLISLWGSRLSLIFFIVIGLTLSVAVAEYCWNYIQLQAAKIPKEWHCEGDPPSGADRNVPSQQWIIDEHYNWHCRNGAIGDPSKTPDTLGQTDEYGRAFLRISLA